MNKSVSKAIRIMKLFTPQEPRLSIAEIGLRLDMPKSTTHNILTSLDGRGLRSRDAAATTTRSAPAILALSQ